MIHYKSYAITDSGHIFRKTSSGEPVLLACQLSNRGYLRAFILGKRRSVHRFLCEAFHGEPSPGMECNHKDGDKLNNAKDNLEWSTKRQNAQHAMRLGLWGKRGPATAKLTPDQVNEIRDIALNGNVPRRKLAAKFGVSRSSIDRVASGETWKSVPARRA